MCVVAWENSSYVDAAEVLSNYQIMRIQFCAKMFFFFFSGWREFVLLYRSYYIGTLSYLYLF